MTGEMLPKRVIACLDVDAGRVVKGTGFTDMRDMGDPVALARRYEAEGADELVFLDISATTEGRSTMVDIARRTASEVFIPFTVGGGVRSETDAQTLLDAGADKVAVNSAALAEPGLIDKLAGRFGKQCVVAAVDAKSDTNSGWEVYAAGGRVATGRSAAVWTEEAVRRGAGEVLLTSIDRDGTNEGYDLELLQRVTETVAVPVIASGGAGQLGDYGQAIQSGAEAVLAASEFHSGRMSIEQVKTALAEDGIEVRLSSSAEDISPVAASPNIAIVDYGVGNRFSVQQALQKVGAVAEVTGDPEEIAQADGIVLPGVGAFGPAMEQLKASGLDTELKRLALAGKPVLGICLGEHLLFNGSEEGGWNEGLGLLNGRVREIALPGAMNIGWRSVYASRTEYFYHVHQYAANPSLEAVVGAWTSLPYAEGPDYKIASMVRKGNIRGVQFHPEKSGPAGLRLLRNFVELSAAARSEI